MEYAPIPTRSQLTALSVEVGFEVAFERRIEGGLGCTTDVLIGDSGQLVLRRHGPWWLDRNPHVAVKEKAVHGVMARHGVPVPSVFWASGPGIFEEPSMVMEHVAGQDPLIPAEPGEAARQLASTLARIHAAAPDAPTRRLLQTPTSPDGDRPDGYFDHPDAERVIARLAELRPQASVEVLIHGDFWPGNTLWREDRLAAVIDWEEATLGDPMNDVAYCALDLRYLGLDDAAETFLETYFSTSHRPADTLAYWTLFALSRPMPDISQWLPAWEARGITHIGAVELRATHHQLLEEALG